MRDGVETLEENAVRGRPLVERKRPVLDMTVLLSGVDVPEQVGVVGRRHAPVYHMPVHQHVPVREREIYALLHGAIRVTVK